MVIGHGWWMVSWMGCTNEVVNSSVKDELMVGGWCKGNLVEDG